MVNNIVNDLVIGREDWRRRLLQQENDVLIRLTQSYARTLRNFEPEVTALSRRLRMAEEAGMRISSQQLRELAELNNLLDRMAYEMDRMATIALDAAETHSQQAAQIGAQGAEQMTLNTAGALRGEVQQVWMRPDPDALRRLAGYVDSEAFQSKWRRFGENAARDFADNVIAFQGQGKGYRATARFIAGRMQVPYGWIENAVRTSSMWSARTAQHASYRLNAQVVQSWIWWASLDERTCLSCVSKHGQEYTHDEILNDHHRGRCTALPRVRGVQWPSQIETGPQWFSNLPSGRQDRQAGAAKDLIEALRVGDVAWTDISSPYQDSVYGEMVRTATLKELGL